MAGLAALGGVFGAMGNIIAADTNYDAQHAAAAINRESQRETNEMNYKIAQEANELELQKFQENMNWLREQYYGDRAWNDPRAMKERYLEAGINPLFAMGNSAGATASSSVGGSPLPNIHTAHMEAPHLEPAQYDFSGISESIGRSIDAFFQNQLINEQTKGLETENRFKMAQISVQINREIAETRKTLAEKEEILSRKDLNDTTREKVEADRDSIRRNLDLLNAQWNDLVQQPKKGNALLDAQVRNVDEDSANKAADTAIKRIEAQWKPVLYGMQIRLTNAQISNLQVQSANVVQQTKNLILEGKLTSYKTAGQYVENRLKDILLSNKEFQQHLRNSSDADKLFINSLELLSSSILGPLTPLFK